MLKIIQNAVFPAPNPSTYSFGDHPENMFYIPRLNMSDHSPNGTFTYGILVDVPLSKYLVLYSHPNAVDIASMLDEVEHFCIEAGVSALLYEFTGYGMCSSSLEKPSEEEILVDVFSAYVFATEYLKVPADRIILMGRSIGGGPATWLSSHLPPEKKPALLFLQCPFTTLRNTAASLVRDRTWKGIGSVLAGAVDFVVPDWFRNVEWIPDVSCPILIMHGDIDDIIALSHSQELADAAQKRGRDVTLAVAEGYRHNDLSVEDAAHLLAQKLRTIERSLFGPKSSRQEKMAPLLMRTEPYWEVRDPYYPVLFPPLPEGKAFPGITVGELLDSWKSSMDLGSLVFSRSHLAQHLVCSLTLFTMRCIYMWKVLNAALRANRTSGGDGGFLLSPTQSTYTTSSERNQPFGLTDALLASSVDVPAFSTSSSSNQNGAKAFTKVEDFIQYCAGVWGSPLGIHLAAAVADNTSCDASLLASYRSEQRKEQTQNNAATTSAAQHNMIPDNAMEFKVFGARVVLSAPAPLSDDNDDESRCALGGGYNAENLRKVFDREYATYEFPIVEDRVYATVWEQAFTPEMISAIHKAIISAPALSSVHASRPVTTSTSEHESSRSQESPQAQTVERDTESQPQPSHVVIRQHTSRELTREDVAHLMMNHVSEQCDTVAAIREQCSQSKTSPASGYPKRESSDTTKVPSTTLFSQFAVSLHESTVNALQQECDKLIAFMKDDDWNHLQYLLSHLNDRERATSNPPATAVQPASRQEGVGTRKDGKAGQSERRGALAHLSMQAKLEYYKLRSRRTVKKVDIDETQCTVSCWTGSQEVDSMKDDVMREVPWDYHLLRARCSVSLNGIVLGLNSPRSLTPSSTSQVQSNQPSRNMSAASTPQIHVGQPSQNRLAGMEAVKLGEASPMQSVSNERSKLPTLPTIVQGKVIGSPTSRVSGQDVVVDDNCHEVVDPVATPRMQRTTPLLQPARVVSQNFGRHASGRVEAYPDRVGSEHADDGLDYSILASRIRVRMEPWNLVYTVYKLWQKNNATNCYVKSFLNMRAVSSSKLQSE